MMHDKQYSFRELEIWKRSKNLSVKMYKIFADVKDFGFRDQITRCSLSIPSNIAEGFGRRSPKEYVRFLLIARGSCAELETQVIIGTEIGYINQDEYKNIVQEIQEITKMIHAFIIAIEKKHDL